MAVCMRHRVSFVAAALGLCLLIFVNKVVLSSASNRASNGLVTSGGAVVPGTPYVFLQPMRDTYLVEVYQILSNMENGDIPTHEADLRLLMISLLRASGNYWSDKRPRLSGIVHFLSQNPSLTQLLLPFLAGVAKRIPQLFPGGICHITRKHPSKHLRRVQVLALLAGTFLGVIPQIQGLLLGARGHRIQMNKLGMHYRGFFERKPKYEALILYFKAMMRSMRGCWDQMVAKNSFDRAECSDYCKCTEVVFEGQVYQISPADEIISFYLHTPERTVFESPIGTSIEQAEITVKDIVSSDIPLGEIVIDLSNDITASDGALQVDFADKHIGGLSMFRDYVAQEELIFALRPELLSIMIMRDALKEDEAIVMRGAESFCLYSGYEETFQIKEPEKLSIPAGKHWSLHGHTPLDPLGRRDTTVLAMDALDLVNREDQYSEKSINREIMKAYLGFLGDPFEDQYSTTRAPIATGKWGCHIFGGNVQLKTLLQWISASFARRKMIFTVFGDQQLMNMEEVIRIIGHKFGTVSRLYRGIKVALRSKPHGNTGQWSMWQTLIDMKV